MTTCLLLLIIKSLMVIFEQASFDIWDKGGRNMAPNGGVMRTSILGVYKYQSLKDVMENTLNICKVTHSDPR